MKNSIKLALIIIGMSLSIVGHASPWSQGLAIGQATLGGLNDVRESPITIDPATNSEPVRCNTDNNRRTLRVNTPG